MPYKRTKAVLGRPRLGSGRPQPPDWTRPGGIVWVGVAIWLLIHLGAYLTVVGGIPVRYFGVGYELPAHRIRAADLRRVLGGSPVLDAHGATVMDPAADLIEVLSVDPTGTTLRFVSSPTRPSGRRLVILVPAPRAEYRDVVAALDGLAGEEAGPVRNVWIADPD